jgi:hypothetical protein
MEGIYLIVSAIIGAIATVASVFVGNRMRLKKRDPLLTTHEHSENIYTALNFVMNEMSSDRAYVFQFHNGSYYLSGRSQQKFSCTHETVSKGISREAELSQNYVVSNYHSYIDELVNEGKFSFTDPDEVTDHAFSALMKAKGIKSVYNIPIKTLNGQIIGILGVDYIKECVKDNTIGFCNDAQAKAFGEETRTFMRRQARIISGYLI